MFAMVSEGSPCSGGGVNYGLLVFIFLRALGAPQIIQTGSGDPALWLIRGCSRFILHVQGGLAAFSLLDVAGLLA